MSVLDLDALLNESLETVQAAPNFITPETSICDLTITDAKAEKKKKNNPAPGEAAEYVALILQYSIDNIHEQAEGTLPMAPGSLFSEQFSYNEKGLPYFKARAIDIGKANGEADAEESIGKAKVGEILAGIKGMRFKCKITKVAGQKEGQFNTRIGNIMPVE